MTNPAKSTDRAAGADTADPRSGRGRAEPTRIRLARAWRATADFVRGVVRKAEADNIFFMAGAIAFNVLVAFVPLVLAALGIAGTMLRLQDADPTETVLRYIIESLPPVSDEFEAGVRGMLHQLLEQSTGLLSIGTVVLIWLSTRLVGTLRTALREIFDIQAGRGIIAGKLFDMKMVVAAGTLLALNVGLTITLRIVTSFGLDFLGIQDGASRFTRFLYGWVVAFLSIWVMFLLIYRYLPPRRIQWGTALVAATFTAVAFELMKQGFGWYVTNVADYTSTYGTFATLIILILWIYYTAVAFILGGEVGQVYAMRRIRRQQKERLR